MAAQSLARESYKEPIETFSTNIMGTVNILESIRQIGKPCVVINVTSDKCYQNTNKIEPYTEEDPMGGYDPYSSSKGCSELITSAFRNSFFDISKSNQQKISVASVRAGNVIGGGDWAKDRLIPDVMKGFLKNEKIQIRNPDSIRPWQFVLEPLNGYLLLAEKLLNKKFEFASSWNFGPDENKTFSVKTILDKIRTKWGLETFVEFKTSNIHEENNLVLNSDKAKKNLNWQPKVNIDLAIRLTMNDQDLKDYRKELQFFYKKAKGKPGTVNTGSADTAVSTVAEDHGSRATSRTAPLTDTNNLEVP